ncbi:unnamed protein product [Brachionus calyciflorus]|uniref:Cilia- and flagella-associated protein 45 n=1 Tax=Brachionus calyciflorus TaxID=104777 RepID=A0A813PZY9_9BILA|nr:unnamed protein product [Brachionus calyciflorus]
MSHSVSSAPSSMSSNSSKRFTRRYRTVNMRSEVDENLFGPPNRVKAAQQMRENKSNANIETRSSVERSSSDKALHKPQKEYIKHITKDLIRDILVPEDSGAKPIVIDKGTYNRLLNACNYKSKEVLEQEKDKSEEDRDKIIKELHERKKLIQKYDDDRKKNEKLEEIDELAKEEAEYLLKKANELRQEDEDEIKRLNELILNAKVHAIRDAQVLEKQQIKKEVKHEEKRLDQMMEVDRLNAIKIQEEIEKKRKQDKKEGAKVILKQIEESRQDKLIKEEMKEQENQAMNKYLEELQAQDWEEVKRRKDVQKKLANDLLNANREMEKQRELRKQQEIIADIKILEYQKEKAARDAAYEAEQERKRIEKEKEIARMRALQERARDLQAEKDALRAKREQERKEREWREQQKFEAMKKKQIEDEMRLAREWQIKNKEHYLAVEAAKERSEFQKVLKAQLELAEKERSEEDKAKMRQKNYSENLQKQIRTNEVQRIQDRRQFFEEGIKLDEEAKIRRAKLDEIKRKKLDELKMAGIPEKYCAEIERRINGAIRT